MRRLTQLRAWSGVTLNVHVQNSLVAYSRGNCFPTPPKRLSFSHWDSTARCGARPMINNLPEPLRRVAIWALVAAFVGAVVIPLIRSRNAVRIRYFGYEAVTGRLMLAIIGELERVIADDHVVVLISLRSSLNFELHQMSDHDIDVCFLRKSRVVVLFGRSLWFEQGKHIWHALRNLRGQIYIADPTVSAYLDLPSLSSPAPWLCLQRDWHVNHE